MSRSIIYSKLVFIFLSSGKNRVSQPPAHERERARKTGEKNISNVFTTIEQTQQLVIHIQHRVRTNAVSK